jgi:methionine-gamma-lyase
MMDHLADKSLAVTLAVSLGQIRTLIEHPASMTHAAIPVADQLRAGIDPGGIRLSIGLETSDDIVGDLEEALETAVLSGHRWSAAATNEYAVVGRE